MANTYKNIVITPNRDTAANVVPNIRFAGGDANTNTDISLYVYTASNGTLSFEGTSGQLFSITNDLTGTIFSVNDISGIPSIEVDANGTISLAPFGGNVGIGISSPTYLLDVGGTVNANSYMIQDKNALSFRGTNETNLYVGSEAGGNTSNNGTGGGQYNTAVGYLALYESPYQFSTAVGAGALSAAKDGPNSAFGYGAMASNLTGAFNTAIGKNSLSENLTGSYNTAVGEASLLFNKISNLTAVGYQALYNNTTGTWNTAIGFQSLQSNVTGRYNTAVGYSSLTSNTGEQNTAMGSFAMVFNSSGASHTAVGYGALYQNTTGNYNTAVGSQSLFNNSSGSYNSAFGYLALNSNTTGNYNTAIGAYSLYVGTIVNHNTSIGMEALMFAENSDRNIAIGSGALRQATRILDSIAIGYQSQYFQSNVVKNISIGTQSLNNNQIGNNNIGVGHQSLYNNLTGSNNFTFGHYAGASVLNGSNNVILGGYTGLAAPISGNGNNWIVLADGAGNVRQVIDPNGNVGIGRTSAGYRLDVAGTVNVSSLLINGASIPTSVNTVTINYVIDGGGSAITPGQKGHLEIPFNCTLNQWSIYLDQTGSIDIEVWKDTYANFPPTVADEINTSPYSVVSGVKAQGTQFTVTSTVTAGDILAFNVASVATATRATIALRATKT